MVFRLLACEGALLIAPEGVVGRWRPGGPGVEVDDRAAGGGGFVDMRVVEQGRDTAGDVPGEGLRGTEVGRPACLAGRRIDPLEGASRSVVTNTDR